MENGYARNEVRDAWWTAVGDMVSNGGKRMANGMKWTTFGPNIETMLIFSPKLVHCHQISLFVMKPVNDFYFTEWC